MRPIGKAHWDVLSPMLDELLESDPDRRAARLAEIRERDEKLSDDLSAFLIEHGAVEREAFLDGHAIHAHDVATLHGQTIGSYALERPLGQGGMGTVWLARRSDGRFEGQVAIKILNLALLRGATRASGAKAASWRDSRILTSRDCSTPASRRSASRFSCSNTSRGSRSIDGATRAGSTCRRGIRLFLDVAAAVIDAHRKLVAASGSQAGQHPGDAPADR